MPGTYVLAIVIIIIITKNKVTERKVSGVLRIEESGAGGRV